MKSYTPAVLVVMVALWLPILLLSASLFGCAPGRTGLIGPMSAPAEHTITNAVGNLITIAPTVAPQPYATAIEAGGAAVLALLAAWQGLTHSKVKTLETNNPVQNKPPTV